VNLILNILLQTVLGKFIDVFVGYPGSCHDAYVWSNSPLYQKLSENSEILIPKNFGDSAYPLTDYLIKPYRNNCLMQPKQKHFNTVLSSTRVIIEQTFGYLKGRFRRWKGIESLDYTLVSHTAVTAAVLHNICKNSGNQNTI